MRHLGAVAMPSSETGDTFKDIQSRCQQYAKARALEDFEENGKISDLTSLQNDIDACTAVMDRGRQVRQALVLTAGLSLAGYLGFVVWKRLG